MDKSNSNFSDNKKNKFNLKKKKDNTIKSLKDVEVFLHDFKKAFNYAKIYKFFRR